LFSCAHVYQPLRPSDDWSHKYLADIRSNIKEPVKYHDFAQSRINNGLIRFHVWSFSCRVARGVYYKLGMQSDIILISTRVAECCFSRQTPRHAGIVNICMLATASLRDTKRNQPQQVIFSQTEPQQTKQPDTLFGVISPESSRRALLARERAPPPTISGCIVTECTPYSCRHSVMVRTAAWKWSIELCLTTT
jgi:hypothetical protein